MMNSREQLISELKKAESIKDAELYYAQLFALTHTYDASPDRKVFVITPYSYDTRNALIAYIQYEAAEIDDHYSMDQDEIIEALVKFYDCEKLILPSEDYQEINLYINWEQFCGYAEGIQSIKMFKRDGLTELLKAYIDSYNESQLQEQI